MVIRPRSSRASAARREQWPTSLKYLLILVPGEDVSLMLIKGREVQVIDRIGP